jgi:hypothetical protein
VTFDTQLIQLMFSEVAQAATDTDMLLDLAIADTGGGNEQIIFPDMMVGWRQSVTSRMGAQPFNIPMRIPAGKALRARCQSIIASDTVDVNVWLMGGGGGAAWPVFTGCDAYGISSSGASTGTAHTPGASGSESTAADIGSTTSKQYKGIMIGLHSANTTTTARGYHWECQIDSTTIAEWYELANTTEEIFTFPTFPYMVRIPSGKQLQVRAESSGTAVAHDVAFYCLY